jgi:hypothetical protein
MFCQRRQSHYFGQLKRATYARQAPALHLWKDNCISLVLASVRIACSLLLVELANSLRSTIVFFTFMITALLKRCVIGLHEQGLAEVEPASRSITRCRLALFASAYPAVRPCPENKTSFPTYQLIARQRSVISLLMGSRYGPVCSSHTQELHWQH